MKIELKKMEGLNALLVKCITNRLITQGQDGDSINITSLSKEEIESMVSSGAIVIKEKENPEVKNSVQKEDVKKDGGAEKKVREKIPAKEEKWVSIDINKISASEFSEMQKEGILVEREGKKIINVNEISAESYNELMDRGAIKEEAEKKKKISASSTKKKTPEEIGESDTTFTYDHPIIVQLEKLQQPVINPSTVTVQTSYMPAPVVENKLGFWLFALCFVILFGFFVLGVLTSLYVKDALEWVRRFLGL